MGGNGVFTRSVVCEQPSAPLCTRRHSRQVFDRPYASRRQQARNCRCMGRRTARAAPISTGIPVCWPSSGWPSSPPWNCPASASRPCRSFTPNRPWASASKRRGPTRLSDRYYRPAAGHPGVPQAFRASGAGSGLHPSAAQRPTAQTQRPESGPGALRCRGRPRTFPTHLSHGLDAWLMAHGESLPEGITVARDGEAVDI